MFDTKLAYVAIGIRARYAMSGTDIAYGAAREIHMGYFSLTGFCSLPIMMVLRACYAVSGTELAMYCYQA
eukprot:3747133-Rhodomonas_salina.8